MAVHRFWRLHCTGNNTTWAAILLSEVQFRATPGGPALAGAWSGTPEVAGQPLAYAHDGDFSTYYQAGGGYDPVDVSIVLDLGAGNESDVQEIALAPSSADNNIYSPAAFELSFSDDGSTWGRHFSYSGVPASTYVPNQFATFGTYAPQSSSKLGLYVIEGTPEDRRVVSKLGLYVVEGSPPIPQWVSKLGLYIVEGPPPPALALVPPSGALPNGTEGLAYIEGLAATGGTAPILYALDGDLPPGMELDPGTGEIAGTCDAPDHYAFTVTATDANGLFGSADYTLYVQPAGPIVRYGQMMIG